MEAESAYDRADFAERKGNYEKAASLFEEAMAKGYEEAKYGLNRVRTICATIEAAARGDMEAQYKLGSFYDVPDAIEWLKKAANQGHKGAAVVQKLLQNGSLSTADREYLRENYFNLSASVRDTYDNYMKKLLEKL